MILYAIRDGFKETTRVLATDAGQQEVEKNHMEQYETIVGMRTLSEQESRTLQSMLEYWSEAECLAIFAAGLELGLVTAAVIHGEIELDQIQL